MSILALSLLWTFFFNMMDFSETQLAPAVSCLTLKSNVESACYKDGNLEIKLKRSLSDEDEKISFFKFIIESESAGTADSYSCGEQCGSCSIPGRGETKTLNYYGISSMPDRVTLFANENCNLGTKEVTAC